ncbi:MAG TPA: penicillin acylase family protein [Vicinamibacterales bacterium]|nr:penicillin acylase family protein [Vicinamibacterales bacterium]
MQRMIFRAIAVVALIALVAAAGACHYLRRSLPQIDGTVTITGLSAPVEIVRDADAIPHIFAATRIDGLFGLGYVHAQDRLWQMEFQRRIGQGRLSEIMGAATLPQDRFLRTVGFGRAARAAWASTPDWAKRQVNAYVAGVNAFIATHHGAGLPPEFTLLRFEPEPWTGEDVVVWVKMMAWDLSANYSFELLRRDLIAAVGPERMAQLMPPYAPDGLSILPRLGESDGSGAPGQLGASSPSAAPAPSAGSYANALALSLSRGEPAVRDFLLGGAATEGLGSNNWVADGTMTASGKPLLANDPHLGTRLPSTWYLAHISAGDFEVIGGTFPGTPAVALGRNRFIAWGATNVAADVEDLYRERLDGAGTHYDFRGAQEAITLIPETIVVKGAAAVSWTVRVTRHGPLVSDAINANNAETRTTPKPPLVEPLAFRWTALDPDDGTLTAFLKVNEAHNWTEFTEALRGYVVPSQNFVFADVEGHIGYYAPGRIPLRASGDGSRPADGWTGDAEWTGWVPFDELPHTFDPPEHVIITANHRPAPPTYRYNLGLEWAEPYRAQRITDLLAEPAAPGPHTKPRFTPDDFARIQADTVSLHARTLLPILLTRTSSMSAADQPVLDLLRHWNFDATRDSAAAALFQAWFLRLAPAIAGDEIGPAALDLYQGKFSFVSRFLLNTLASNDSPWCDDLATPKRETCDEVVASALRAGVDDLQRRLGSDTARWRWDAVHTAVFPHALDSVAALRPILSRSIGAAGDWSTVNVSVTAADHPYEAHTVPGYREIIDLSPANDSRFLDAVGESGHPLSPHYDDFMKDWRAVTHRKMRMDRAEIERGALGHLRLTP